ncbi:MAG: protease modulator HflC [Oscillospiraceae bacterium]
MKIFKKFAIVIVIAVATIIIAGNTLFVTKENEYKVIQQFGEMKRVVNKAGINVKVPFLQTTLTLPKQTLLYDLPVSDVITSDKQTLVADSFVLWKITDPILYFKTLGGTLSNAESRINTIVYNSMKNVISSKKQSDIISGRDKLAQDINNNLGDVFTQYGIELLGIETKHLDLPQDNKEAVFVRMISERNNIAAKYEAEGKAAATKIQTETDKNINIKLSEAKSLSEKLIAEGEAEYMKILAGAYNTQERAEFYDFVRSLDAAKKCYKEGTTIILDKDSPLADIFYGK